MFNDIGVANYSFLSIFNIEHTEIYNEEYIIRVGTYTPISIYN